MYFSGIPQNMGPPSDPPPPAALVVLIVIDGPLGITEGRTGVSRPEPNRDAAWTALRLSRDALDEMRDSDEDEAGRETVCGRWCIILDNNGGRC